MAYNMKGSPFQRNFGIGASPVKQGKDWYAKDTRTDEQKKADKVEEDAWLATKSKEEQEYLRDPDAHDVKPGARTQQDMPLPRD